MPRKKESYGPLTGEQIDTIYVNKKDRFIVSLVVGYNNVRTAKEAARAALELTKDEACSGTNWYVFDRKMKIGCFFEQDEIDR